MSKDTIKNILHIDRLENAIHFDRISDAPDYLIIPFKETKEGFLKGRAVITNVGVFTYLNEDGSIRRELRHPSEVFDEDSLKSLSLSPITNDHPLVLVNSDNAKDLQVGSTGEFPITDPYHIATNIVINQKEAVNDVKDGKTDLSCGYICDLEVAEPGANYLGVPYDFIQRNIRYNHTAIVDSARAGNAAKIKIRGDSNNSVAVLVEKIHNDGGEGMDTPNLKSVKLDGVDYQAEAEVIKALTTAKKDSDDIKKQLDSLLAEKDKLSAERDTLKDANAKLDEKIKELEEKQLDTEVIDAAVEEKLQILDAAKRADIEITEDMDNESIRKAVILKVFPEAKLDGKSADYLEARFDGAVEQLDDVENGDASQRSDALSGNLNTDTGDVVTDSKSAREKMVKANLERSRKAGGE